MNILKITIEGLRKSGKSTVLYALKRFLESDEFEKAYELRITCDKPIFDKNKSTETMEIAVSQSSQ